MEELDKTPDILDIGEIQSKFIHRIFRTRTITTLVIFILRKRKLKNSQYQHKL